MHFQLKTTIKQKLHDTGDKDDSWTSCFGVRLNKVTNDRLQKLQMHKRDRSNDQ